MTEIIGVRFKDGGKLYYFNPNGVQVQAGQHVIIETSKGIEFGECALANTMIDEMELIAALRPMLRVATEEDYAQVKANQEKEKKAFQICQDKIAEHKLEMKLVEVKYSFDGSKILFFFTWSKTWRPSSAPALSYGRSVSETRRRSWAAWASAGVPSAVLSF